MAIGFVFSAARKMALRKAQRASSLARRAGSSVLNNTSRGERAFIGAMAGVVGAGAVSGANSRRKSRELAAASAARRRKASSIRSIENSVRRARIQSYESRWKNKVLEQESARSRNIQELRDARATQRVVRNPTIREVQQQLRGSNLQNGIVASELRKANASITAQRLIREHREKQGVRRSDYVYRRLITN